MGPKRTASARRLGSIRSTCCRETTDNNAGTGAVDTGIAGTDRRHEIALMSTALLIRYHPIACRAIASTQGGADRYGLGATATTASSWFFTCLIVVP